MGTNDARIVEDKALEGVPEYAAVLDAFHYQMAKDIGAMATVLNGKVDKIILTGGIAYSKVTCEDLKKRVGWIADFVIYPGEDELLALAQFDDAHDQHEAFLYHIEHKHQKDQRIPA